jgi:hypothetical protein
MNASDELQSVYHEWRRLARTEGEAIRDGNWLLVAECQNSMQLLQPRIVRCTEAARQEWARPGADGAAREKSVQTLIAELIEIERRNNALLDTVRGNSQVQLGELKQAGHTLRQVQKSYSPTRPPVWTSFS